MGIAFFVLLKLVAIGYGVVAAIRARFLPALALGVSVICTLVLLLVVLVRPTSVVVTTVVAALWAPVLTSAAAGAAATVAAFRRLDRELAGSAAEQAVSTLAYALLGNTLLDAAALVITIFATIALSQNG